MVFNAGKIDFVGLIMVILKGVRLEYVSVEVQDRFYQSSLSLPSQEL
jgi:hypothetical protein